jgi:hypothetical protein
VIYLTLRKGHKNFQSGLISRYQITISPRHKNPGPSGTFFTGLIIRDWTICVREIPKTRSTQQEHHQVPVSQRLICFNNTVVKGQESLVQYV